MKNKGEKKETEQVEQENIAVAEVPQADTLPEQTPEKEAKPAKAPKAKKPKKAGKPKDVFSIVCKTILHLLGFPLLAVLVIVLNRNVFKDGNMYGIFAFVSIIVVALMAFVYYVAYFLSRAKKSRSIRNQTVIIAIVAMCCLSGFWMLIDGLAADTIEDLTSSTIRWEDLSDNWQERSDVNHELLVDYVTMNYQLGRLTAPNGETVEDYVKQGPKNKELAKLLEEDFTDIDGDGFNSFKGPSIDYAQDDRMTIPVLIHLFLDDRSSMQAHVKMPVAYYYNTYYNKAAEDQIDSQFAAYAAYEKEDLQAHVEDCETYAELAEVMEIYAGVQYEYDEEEADNKLKAADKEAAIKEGKEAIDAKYEDKKEALQEDGNFILRIYHGYDGNTNPRTKSFLITDDELNIVASVTAVNIVSISEGKYCATHVARSTEGGQHFETTTERFGSMDEAVEYLQTEYACGENYFVCDYRLASVGWHVLDMSGEGMDMDMSGLISPSLMNTDIPVIGKKIGDIVNSDLLPDTFALVADMLNEDEMLGSPLYISLDSQTGEMSLDPSNNQRGVLGYMQIAWLNNNASLFMLASVFSCRTIFYIWGPVMVLITILLGAVREREKKKLAAKVSQADAADAAQN